MEPIAIIKELSGLKSRLGETEADARQLICNLLREANVNFAVQEFSSERPEFKDYSLTADGQTIDCLPTGLKSGMIENAYNLISSLTSSQKFIDTPNINFNPRSDSICQCNFYFAPSVAISRLDVPKVMQAKNVLGHIEVRSIKYKSANILVGNLDSPKSIAFAHYDAYFSGATDNASGVGTALSLLLEQPNLLKNNLIVFAGNEELSYDYPVYWGRCFREFARRNRKIIKDCRKIIVIDSVGDGKPVIEDDPHLLSLAFPIGGDQDILAKSCVLTGDFDNLMSVYHSEADQISRLDSKLLELTVSSLQNLLN